MEDLGGQSSTSSQLSSSSSASSSSALFDGRPKKLQVKNKAPAPIQITAEQLLREAVDRQADEVKPPSQRIVDEEELNQYRLRKRKEYEDILRRQRHHIGTWIKYAEWEAAQKEFRRARSVFERAITVDYQNVTLWLKYIEMEMKNRFISSARNLYNRCCQLLPRVDQFWFKYAHMEEILGNYAGARSVYDRWMEWNPDDKGWMIFIRFEERCGELERCRRIFERYLSNRPSEAAFLRFAKFEEKHRNIPRCRAGFEKAIELLPEDYLSENFYIRFAQFEERQHERERAKKIYEEALKRLPRAETNELYRNYLSFQKQFGKREELEDVVLEKRRVEYEVQIKENKENYDVWFDYINLEESAGKVKKIREVYERAIACIPPANEKRYWKRYIYLWINYALFEELQTGDIERCRKVYDKMISIVPHKEFSFAKIWILYAEFEVRELNIDKARKIYGRSIGECGKEKLFTSYASLELRLGNLDRVRKIYAKYVEMFPFNPKSWMALVDLEVLAEEKERARRICEIAIGMEQMDMPELLWKKYIDFEIDDGEFERARSLFERLLKKTQHFKVFKAYADFEISYDGKIDNARKIMERGLELCKENGMDEERALLLQHLLHLENRNGDQRAIQKAFQRLPKKVKRRRKVVMKNDDDNDYEGTRDKGADGNDDSNNVWEEYVAYVFPDDGQFAANIRILEAAKAWKRRKEIQEQMSKNL